MAPPAKNLFKVGDEVEISSDEDGFRGAWFKARVVRVAGRAGRAGRYTVVYDSITDGDNNPSPLRETVDAAHIRPRPPRRPFPDCYDFNLHKLVDAFHNDAWWGGVVLAVHEGEGGAGEKRRYTVRFDDGEEGEFGAEEIRPRAEWIDGGWVLPESQDVQEVEFTTGSIVEVRSDDEGFRGVWFAATIVNSLGERKFLVEYQDLKTDDETDLLKETTDFLHIRPTPPQILLLENFKLLEEVDAFHNGGWWLGVISKVLGCSRYIVYFRTWKEEIEFGQHELRHHHDFIDGKWLQVSQALDL